MRKSARNSCRGFEIRQQDRILGTAEDQYLDAPPKRRVWRPVRGHTAAGSGTHRNSTCGGQAGYRRTGVRHSDCCATIIRQSRETAFDQFRYAQAGGDCQKIGSTQCHDDLWGCPNNHARADFNSNPGNTYGIVSHRMSCSVE